MQDIRKKRKIRNNQKHYFKYNMFFKKLNI